MFWNVGCRLNIEVENRSEVKINIHSITNTHTHTQTQRIAFQRRLMTQPADDLIA